MNQDKIEIQANLKRVDLGTAENNITDLNYYENRS
jgi:hypothetical protein